ncbi:MAG: succinate dehydrogenase [Deltaproteobacteria bacterium]|nr:MAG: succinate dehydrogenase [Deltaproteobacteria bacterium]
MQRDMALSFYRTAVGKKAVVAVTGIALALFLLVHMLGNLQLFSGPEALNGYARFLHSKPAIVGLVRIVLVVVLVVHVTATLQLFLQNRAARPQGYRMRRYEEVDASSSTMVVTGPLVLAFLAYHLLHFTFGSAHPSFQPGDVYHNVVAGFSNWWVSGTYILANLLLFLHLRHGLWSWFQTLGLAHPRYNHWRRWFAWALSLAIGIGNISMPVAVLAGWVR